MTRRKHKGRNINGILLLDKPDKYTSNQALQKVKRLLNANKAGHTGSLDPLATGMLPICFGEATKVSSYLLNADKTYEVGCQLGVRTDSADSDGNVIEVRSEITIDEARLHTVIRQFVGTILQVPPMHSAIKQNGTPLYKLAHLGIEVAREARPISIYNIANIELRQSELSFTVKCSKGTYIRTLVDDIGEALGCGAHVIQLRRTQVGPFEHHPLITMDMIETLLSDGYEVVDGVLLPVEEALKFWPAVVLTDDAAFYLQQGQAVFIPRNKNRGYVRLFMRDNRFLGVGHTLDDGRVAPKRLMNLTKIG